MFHESTKTFCDIFYIECGQSCHPELVEGFFTIYGSGEKILGGSTPQAEQHFTGLSYSESVSKAHNHGWLIEKI